MRRAKKVCPITEAGIRYVDYKDDRLLGRFITDNGKILPSRLSGVDARHQRQLAKANVGRTQPRSRAGGASGSRATSVTIAQPYGWWPRVYGSSAR